MCSQTCGGCVDCPSPNKSDSPRGVRLPTLARQVGPARRFVNEAKIYWLATICFKSQSEKTRKPFRNSRATRARGTRLLSVEFESDTHPLNRGRGRHGFWTRLERIMGQPGLCGSYLNVWLTFCMRSLSTQRKISGKHPNIHTYNNRSRHYDLIIASTKYKPTNDI